MMADRAFVEYIRMAVELVAVLSWLAGWIAVAVNTGTGACEEGYASYGALKAATLFEAMQWLLFMIITYLTISLALSSRHRTRTPAA
jgi:hypothetical protein